MAVLESDRLAWLARQLMKDSDNSYANMFGKTMARHLAGKADFQTFDALARDYLDAICKDGASGFSLADGAGMSVRNYLKPRQLVEMLYHGITQPWAAEWLETFPIMGVDGSLKRWQMEDGNIKGRVWAKTGYINRVRNLSGYLKTESGEPIIFSIMVNNYDARTSEIDRAIMRICNQIIKLKFADDARDVEILSDLFQAGQ